jgi:protein ImuA
MQEARAHIIQQLQQEILALQGFKSVAGRMKPDVNWQPINRCFPNNTFPVGAIHEFLTSAPENMASSMGFLSALLSVFMKNGQATLWISSSRSVFPPALKAFGIEPDRILFTCIKKEKDITWAMEEALKCEALAAVVGEVQDISFTASRRLQLAVEQSRVTGFLLRRNPRNTISTACISRWKITPLPSEQKDELPGIGSPRWNVELQKVRNGKAGSWQVEWSNGALHFIAPESEQQELQKKTG